MLPSLDRAATIVLADDEWMFRASLRQLLTAPPSVIKDVYGVDTGHGFSVVGEAGSGQEAVSTVESTRPDLLILDLDMPRMSGLEAMRALQPARGTLRTVLLSGNMRKSEVLIAVQLGINAVILKDAPTEMLFAAMLSALAGRHWLDQRLVGDLMEMVKALEGPPNSASRRRPFGLTRRELEVLALVVAGCSNKEIARTCAVSEETVKHHLTRMFDKVGASNRLELAMIATDSGLVIEPPAPVSTDPPKPPDAADGATKSGHLRVIPSTL